MKKLARTFRVILLVFGVGLMCTSCKYVSKYVGDIFNGRRTVKVRHMSIPKDCPYCDDGYYWRNGYQYECGHCDGKGWRMEKVY